MSAALPPRLDLVSLPTRIDPLPRISAALGGPRIWVKRDDDTGAILTGNKIRKLQFVVRQALDEGADTLITCGGTQSNHCRATAAVARRLGLSAVLCLRGTDDAPAEGNLLLDRMLGADIRWLTPEAYARHDAIMAEVADELRAAGRRPFVIAEGASMPRGVAGYVEAAREIAEQQAALGIRFDAIVHAVGSGGTSAGLELGARRFGIDARVVGIAVCDDAPHFRRVIAHLCTGAANDLGWDLDVPAQDIEIDDRYKGPAYGAVTPGQTEAMVAVARAEGLVLDPVYSGKAWHALCEEIVAGRLRELDEVLFVHTGGVFGLMARGADLPLQAPTT